MDKEIVLSESDRTKFAKCLVCCKTGIGVKVGDYFSMAYSAKQWARQPVCDNCGTAMTLIYEVKTDD